MSALFPASVGPRVTTIEEAIARMEMINAELASRLLLVAI